jgi:RNA polymerase sigma-70 factor (ECF subfamily)
MGRNSKWALVQGFGLTHEEVYRKYAGPLLDIVARFTGNRTEAEDIVGDLFLRILECDEHWRQEDRILGYLVRRARNLAIDRMRAVRPHRRRDGHWAWLTGDAEEARLPARVEWEWARVLEVVHAEMGKLPGRTRQVTVAYYLNGRSNEQIADETGTALQTVRNQRAKGVGMVREMVMKHASGAGQFCWSID